MILNLDLQCENRDLLTKEVEDRPIAMLFQSNNLFPHLTIFRNVALAMTSRRWLTKFSNGRLAMHWIAWACQGLKTVSQVNCRVANKAGSIGTFCFRKTDIVVG